MHRALSSPAPVPPARAAAHEPDLDTAALTDRLQRPGRPRLLYRAVPDEQQPAPAADDAGYRFLASILASYLGAAFEDTSAAAEQAGQAWGGFVVDKPAPFTKLDPAEAVDRLVAMLDEFGFAPDFDDQGPDAPGIVLRRCPFLDVAREHQEVVCSIHLGLMHGALDELGVDVQARDLIPWAQPTRASHTSRSAQARRKPRHQRPLHP